jgi:hypothetical protein
MQTKIQTGYRFLLASSHATSGRAAWKGQGNAHERQVILVDAVRRCTPLANLAKDAPVRILCRHWSSHAFGIMHP